MTDLRFHYEISVDQHTVYATIIEDAQFSADDDGEYFSIFSDPVFEFFFIEEDDSVTYVTDRDTIGKAEDKAVEIYWNQMLEDF